MTLTQWPDDDIVTLRKGGKVEKFKNATLDSDGKEVIIKNSKYKEIIYKNGSIEFEISGRYTNACIVDKHYKKSTAKYYPPDRFFYRVSPIEVWRNTDDTGKDLYLFDDSALKPFVSLTELNTTYWPRK